MCGELRRHASGGLCSRCWQRDPQRPFVAGEHLAARLEDPPAWLDAFVVQVAGVYSPGRACNILTALGRLLLDGQPNHPQALLDCARTPGRSLGPLARSLQAFFTERGLAMPTDHAEQLAAGRRKRRIDAVPATLRPAVAAFAESMLTTRTRARRAGTLPRSDRTIETALATLRDLARFLNDERGKQDWSTIDVADIEEFLNLQPDNRPRRLTVLRQFFRYARTRRLVLVDPTRGLAHKQPKGFRGATLTLERQRQLFRRWTTDPTVHPHEALVGILALLHGASSRELRLLRCDTIDQQACTIGLDGRPHPVPLDPASWAVLTRCLAHRQSQHTRNPHVIVTKVTKTAHEPASAAYLTHVLDACGLTPRTVRSTRLVDLVNTMDPKLMAVAFGMTPEAAMIYLADHVDPTRLPSEQISAHPGAPGTMP
jgi:site-specific recombinase XerD